jgi:hypothetical protein
MRSIRASATFAPAAAIVSVLSDTCLLLALGDRCGAWNIGPERHRRPSSRRLHRRCTKRDAETVSVT